MKDYLAFGTALLRFTAANQTLAWSAGQTIFHRLAMLSRTGSVLNAREIRELVQMYSEKLEASGESAQIWFKQTHAVNHPFWVLAVQPWQLAAASLGVVCARTPAQWAAAQQRWWTVAWQGGAAALKFWTASLDAVHKGNAPFHSRVSANARRLGRLAPPKPRSRRTAAPAGRR